jgi:osmotically-inducible protein OsmY
MKTDTELKNDVEAELLWDPSLDAAHVGVAVKDGVVTLSGHLDSYAEKHAAERAAQRVRGVRAVAVEVDVRLKPHAQRNDADIAAAARSALQWHALVPADRLEVLVERGWVTLSGEVDWDYQRNQAVAAVRALTGVIGVANLISVKPQTTPADVKARIRKALERRAERETKGIEVVVSGHTATLQGEVQSWAERMAAQGAAWSAPGITQVVNQLRVV